MVSSAQYQLILALFFTRKALRHPFECKPSLHPIFARIFTFSRGAKSISGTSFTTPLRTDRLSWPPFAPAQTHYANGMSSFQERLGRGSNGWTCAQSRELINLEIGGFLLNTFTA
ncbi:hypothetical protein CEXT_706761 [Caerostris extrusa]|uniref:Uncharacterized protein n=1 Tax=Caerostris extrusa TaxID=172846 RepID=A0AAV4PXC4_CAEEX|nr:hypothetical protein CEXT_706761 [Caerostris extrusa]